MISMMLAAALLLAEASPAAAAAEAPAAAAPTANKVKASKEGMICRREEISGTKMKKKVCATAQEREERREMDRDALDRQQRVMQVERG